MDISIGLVVAILLMAAVLVGVRFSTEAARRKRYNLPTAQELQAALRPPPPQEPFILDRHPWETTTWSSTTTTLLTERPALPATESTDAPSNDTLARVDTLMREMNQHLTAARFDEALEKAEELEELVSSLPPGQREVTIRQAGGVRTISTSVSASVKPKAGEPAKVKTRFDLIG